MNIDDVIDLITLMWKKIICFTQNSRCILTYDPDLGYDNILGYIFTVDSGILSTSFINGISL